jgi:hypothetical protein
VKNDCFSTSFFLSFLALGFEFRASCLLGRHFIEALHQYQRMTVARQVIFIPLTLHEANHKGWGGGHVGIHSTLIHSSRGVIFSLTYKPLSKINVEDILCLEPMAQTNF